MNQNTRRCDWANSGMLMTAYHDREWGVPLHDDNKLFEFLILDCFQAGLSWSTILKKRFNFRRAFDNFNYKKIAKYRRHKVNSLLNDSGIIRNRLKIQAATLNAQKFLEIQKEFLSFDKYIWSFVGSTICYAFMQAAGLVNDHLTTCFRYREVS